MPSFKAKTCEDCKIAYIPTSGTQKRCPECGLSYRRRRNAEFSQQYYEANKHGKVAAWRTSAAGRASAARQNRRQYDKNREQRILAARAYYASHREEVAEKNRRYRQAHRDELSEKARKYNAEHREENAERNRRYKQQLKIRGALLRTELQEQIQGMTK